MATTLKKYVYNLVVGVREIGENCFQLPIRANCIVPDILISASKIHFGECFIGQSYVRVLELGNRTKQPAKFEITTPSNDENTSAQILVDMPKGIVPSRSTQQLQITLNTQKLGTIIMPLYIKIIGSQNPPFEISIGASSVGPVVSLDRAVIDWGKMQVLQDHVDQITLQNASPIPAKFKVSLKHNSPTFCVKSDTGIIPSESSITLDVIFLPDDSIKFTEELIITITNGDILTAKLIGSGRGFSIVSDVEIEDMDLGSHFTERILMRTFTLTNMSRRPQAIQWILNKPRKKGEEQTQIFKIIPDRVVISPQSTEEFIVEGMSQHSGAVQEQFICRTTGKKQSILYTCNLKCHFILPLIKCSKDILTFEYSYHLTRPPVIQCQSITLKNVSPLPLRFSLKSDGPFSVDNANHILQSDESCIVNIKFDPVYAGDRLSRTVHQKLNIVYEDHPQRDSIDLHAAIDFPNLVIDSDIVDFGAVMNNTEQRRILSIRNVGKIEADFHWKFELEHNDAIAHSANSFDVVPNRGIIHPGRSMDIEFIFNGGENKLSRVNALCSVKDGPVYRVAIHGEANQVQYRLEKNVLDFGTLPLDAVGQRELVLHNTGKVPFTFSIRLESAYLRDMLLINPMSGIVSGSSRSKIVVQFLPGIPEAINEHFQLNIDNHSTEDIAIQAIALNPVVVLGLPREEPSSVATSKMSSSGNFMKQIIERLVNTEGLKSRINISSTTYAAIEEERIQLKEHLVRNPISFNKRKNARSRPSTGFRSRPSSSRQTTLSHIGIRTGSIANPEINTDSLTSWVTGRYFYDFGNIICGKTYKKSFRLTNFGILPVSIDADRKTFSARGFNITPSEVKKLPGYPQHESVTFELTFNTKKIRDLPDGLDHFITNLPIRIVDGPLIELKVNAKIIVPELEITVLPPPTTEKFETQSIIVREEQEITEIDTDMEFMSTSRTLKTKTADIRLEFGKLLVGQCKFVTIQLENKQELTCDWTLEEIKSRRSRKERTASQFNVKQTDGSLRTGEKQFVEFSFIPEAARRFSTVFSLKFAHSNVEKQILCTGIGEELAISVEPECMEIGPTQPYTPIDMPLTLSNNSDYAVEIYSFNYDKQYLEEQEILQNTEGYEGGYLLIPPRKAGSPLPRYLVNAYEQQLVKNTPQLESPDVAFDSRIEMSGVTHDQAELNIDSDDDLDPKQKSMKQTFPVIVFHGTPYSGCTQHSHHLAMKMAIPIISIDRIFQLEQQRRSGENRTETQEDEMSSVDVSGTVKDIPSLDSDNAEKHGRIIEYTAETLTGICKNMMTSDEFQEGFVIDGLHNTYDIPELEVARALIIGCKPHPVYIATLSTNEITMRIRDLTYREDLAKAELESSEVEQITEDEFDLLSDDMKRIYGLKLGAYRDNKKQLEEIAKTKKSLLETLETLDPSSPELIDISEMVQLYQQEYDAYVQQQLDNGSKKKSSKKKTDTELPPVLAPEEQYKVKDSDDVTASRLKAFKRNLLALEELFDELPFATSPEEVQQTIDDGEKKKRQKTNGNGKSAAQGSTLEPIRSKFSFRFNSQISFDDMTHRIFESLPNLITKEEKEKRKKKSEIPIPDPYVRQRIAYPTNENLNSSKHQNLFKIIDPMLNAFDTGPDSSQQSQHVEEMLERTRWVLQPRSKKSLFVRFISPKIGLYETALKFGVTGWNTKYELACKALCAVPEISTFNKQVFPYRVKSRPQSGDFVHGRYVVSEKVFDFGPLLIRPSYDDNFMDDTKRSSAYRTEFQMANTGQFIEPTEVTLMLEDERTSNAFMIPTPRITLHRDMSETVVLWAFPNQIGRISNTVICMVKDNPTPFRFNITCIGADPSIALSSTTIDFGKLLLTENQATQVLTITNTTTIPVAWKFSEIEKLESIFSVNPMEGILNHGMECEIEVHFHPKEPCVARNQLIIDYCDKDGIIPAKKIALNITAEAYDIKGVKLEQELDFGTVRVSDGGQRSIFLSNSGKYDVLYSFEIPSHLEPFFTVIDKEGKKEGTLVSKDKKNPRTECVVTFKTTKEITLCSNTDIKVNFFEPDTNKLLGTESLVISVNSVFSKFSILPVHGINFGPLNFGKERTKEFEILNRGDFPFQFSISDMTVQTDKTPLQLADESKRKKTPNKQSRTKKKMSSIDEIAIGKFRISPVEGEIAPGSNATVNVTFHADGSELSCETLAISIEHCDPSNHKNGVPLDITGESCIPGIAAMDFESIFEEQQIIHSLDMLSMYSGSVFCVEDRVLFFGTIAASHKVEERIKITNPFKVPCNIEVVLKPSDNNDVLSTDAFDAQPKKLMIPSYEHRYLTLYFTPSHLHTYSAIFTLSVVDGRDNDFETKELKFEMRGDGSLPQVTIEKPLLDVHTGSRALLFPKTLIGRRTGLPIVIRNDATLNATVRFELPFHSALTMSDSNKDLVLQNGELRQLMLYFEPKSVETIETSIAMTVLDNHFENSKIMVSAEGVRQDVTFEELPLAKFEELDFGDCDVGVEARRTFIMQNHSKHPIRFEWETSADITFSPTVGHLQAESTLDVTALFYNTEPRQLKEQAMCLRMAHIRYLDSNSDHEWDDRHKTVQWEQVEVEEHLPQEHRKEVKKVTKSTKTRAKHPENEASQEAASHEKRLITKRFEVVNPEPMHEHIRDLPNKNLAISCNADYCRYDCDLPMDQPIKFKTTNILSSKSFSFSMSNPGRVDLRYRWRQIYQNENETPVIDMQGDRKDGDEVPFSIAPQHGTISPGETVDFVLKYSPVDVNEHIQRFECVIPNLEPTVPLPHFVAEGRSICPIVHFELSPSDYLVSGRRNPELPGPEGKYGALDARTRVIELHSTGVKIRTTKRFYIQNPTITSYNFEWIRIHADFGLDGQNQVEQGIFSCRTRKGIIQSGKKVEIVFEYTAESVEPQESFWIFRIPDHNFDVPFLVAGFSTEPKIFLDKARLNFQAVLVGDTAKQIVNICNREKIPFGFSFRRNVFTSNDLPDGNPIVTVLPSSGTVAAGQDIPIEVIYTPDAEESYNFNLQCHVNKKPLVLSCNIKGEGFSIHEKLELENDSKHGKPLTLHPSPRTNSYNFGKTQINEKCVKRITISNLGRYSFDYQWHNSSSKFVSIHPEVGTVKRGNREIVELVFNPVIEGSLSDHKLVCKIANGNSYVLHVSGKAKQPKLHFSFLHYDFGASLIFREPTGNQISTFRRSRNKRIVNIDRKRRRAVLTVTNRDDSAITFDILYDVSPHLEVTAPTTSLKRGESTTVNIVFMPREVQSYKEIVIFVINQLYSVRVTVTGEGVLPSVELVDVGNTLVDLGAATVGESIRKIIPIRNSSKIPLTVSFEENNQATLSKKFIALAPKDGTLIKPDQIMDVTVLFNPRVRLPPFSEELVLQVEDIDFALLNLTGSSQGTEIKLDTQNLDFGRVVPGTMVTRKVVMENIGDMGATYKWNAKRFAPYFTIKPIQGYIPLNGEISFDVTFHTEMIKSRKAAESIKLDNLECKIDNSKPLVLSITASCVDKPDPKGDVKFSCSVRESQTTSIKVDNPTESDWNLKPSIDNSIWSGKDLLIVPAKGSSMYELTYKPLRMASNDKTDRGTLFLPLPNGQAYLFNLIGEATAPESSGIINREFLAKNTHTESVSVKNWLPESQRFYAHLEFRDLKEADKVYGPPYIDVPGLSTREFKFTFLSFIGASEYSGTVKFVNQETGEYMFYELKFSVRAPQIIRTIEMETPVRQRVSHFITAENPLDTPVEFRIICSSQDIIVPATVTLKPRSEERFEMIYFPLEARSIREKHTLDLESNALGIYPYKLVLKSMPASAEKNVHFRVPIGSTQTQTVRFISYARTPTDFSHKLPLNSHFSLVNSKGAIKAAACVNPLDGIEITFDVKYEPSELGNSSDVLTLSSPLGGEYSFVLLGNCIPPKPQGPIEIVAGGSAKISFKNVFPTKMDFQLSLDDQTNFQTTVKGSVLSLQSKTKTDIVIHFKPMHDDALTYAKLTLSCPACVWTYYLMGKK